jgi:3-hydroxyisobutyrate dehydrogenase-like beta-hydroxyacid dehydrogenase
MGGQQMPSVGFVGLGHMGGSIAARLLVAGHTVHGSARRREPAQSLVDQGLHWCDTPRALADAADIVFTSLPDDAAVEAVASAPDGLLAGLHAGQVWADMSTISPRASRELAPRVRATGAELLDAPVSGSVPQVEAGTLTIMVGGRHAAYRTVEPVLRELGTPTHIGDHGQGLVLKLAINISLAVQMLAFSEGLLLAVRQGIDPRLAADVMAGSAIGSPMLKARVPLVLDLPDEPWFDIDLMDKDVRLALATAREGDVPLPAAGVADEVLTRAGELGYEHRDIAALFEVLGRLDGEPVAGR